VIKGKSCPTLATKATDPDLIFDAGKEGQETTGLVISLNTWKKDRRFDVSRVLKDEKNGAQIFFRPGRLSGQQGEW
jgi:hypothetical protein